MKESVNIDNIINQSINIPQNNKVWVANNYNRIPPYNGKTAPSKAQNKNKDHLLVSGKQLEVMRVPTRPKDTAQLNRTAQNISSTSERENVKK